MAMSESSPAPPYGAVANKDNTHQGECESDENQGNEEAACDIDPADLEDGEILDDSEGEGAPTSEPKMVNFEKVLLNNPIGDSDGEGKKKKKKRPKRPDSAGDEPSKKRKKFSDHRSGDMEERNVSPNSRSRQKRHREKSSFDEDRSSEERRHQKGGKGSILQRLGERSAGRPKGRSGSKLNLARKRAQMVRPPMRKREPRPKTICKFFLEGNCNKGEVCTFSHDTTPYKKKDLCKFYLHGYCTKEDACLFMHNEFPCKFFHTGAVCYADTECRFSHKPLTEEGRMLLDRYLDSGPKNDRRRDHTPPPNRMDRGRPPPHHHPPPHPHHHPNSNNMNECNMKMRPSLLGSPPPHIKEAASEWQQDLMMQMHQHEKSPPQMTRPNFYMDTMEESPQRGMMHGNVMNEMDNFQMGGPFTQSSNCGGDGTPQQGGATPIPTDDEGEGDMDDQMSFPQSMQRRFFHHQKMGGLMADTEKTISAAISAIRAETDGQRTPPHLEVEKSLSPRSRPDVNDQPPNLLVGSPQNESPTKAEKKDDSKNDIDETTTDASEGDQSQSASDDIPPLLFPSHLPRKQRELFMRIQQHQRLAKLKAQGGGESSTDEDQLEEKSTKLEVVEDETSKEVEAEKSEGKVKEQTSEPQGKKSEGDDDEETEEEDFEDDREKPREKWYSSDEDDDENGDQPLTDVLKRLQQMPPPMAPPPAAAPPAPAIDIAKMLSSIREQATQQTGGLSSGLKKDFWQNILSDTAPPANLPNLAEVDPNHSTVKRDPRSRATPAKLPSPQTGLPLSVDKSVNRPLNARDPRLSRAIPKPECESVVPVIKPKPPDMHPAKEERIWESTSRDKEKKPGQPVYKLHTVTVMPLNYSSYLFATQNDTKLLEDPRLKKLLSGTTPPRPMASLPFPPELQQFLEQGDASKQPKQSPSSSSTTIPPTTVTTPLPPTLPQASNLILGCGSGSMQKSDPRLKRSIPNSAQSPVHSGGFTPPHPTTPMMDMPPNVLPGSGGFTPPTPPINHQMMDMPNSMMMGFPPPRPMNPMMDMGHPAMMHGPMLHTHMPRSFIDPRFARLQQPMNLRRGRGNVRHQGPPRKMHRDGSNRPPAAPVETKTNEPPESEQDNKTQRKKQMDYTSPLSAYDESTPSEVSAYNRRPQQNPRTNVHAATPGPTSSQPLQPPASVTIPQANIPTANKTDMPNENIETQSEDINAASLRDVFKTIDPTASPFC